jgi:Mn2+/Fe2+ NRAMP family transporter
MTDKPHNTRKLSLFAMLGPGLLVAATGVGAGDLATASFAGSLLGNGILWAAVLGAFLKYVVNEAVDLVILCCSGLDEWFWRDAARNVSGIR